MAFKQKTWTDRIAEFINRRLLTKEDGTTELVTVVRSEGQVSAEGDAFNAETMNDLEQRIADAFSTAITKENISQQTVAYAVQVGDKDNVNARLGVRAHKGNARDNAFIFAQADLANNVVIFGINGLGETGVAYALKAKTANSATAATKLSDGTNIITPSDVKALSTRKKVTLGFNDQSLADYGVDCYVVNGIAYVNGSFYPHVKGNNLLLMNSFPIPLTEGVLQCNSTNGNAGTAYVDSGGGVYFDLPASGVWYRISGAYPVR